MVSFCEKCGSLLIPKRHEDNSVTLVCRVCKIEAKNKFKDSSYSISSKIRHDEKDLVTIVEEDFDIRPITKINCPKCNNHEARYWEAENRRKTEEWETTMYFKCTKCRWVWSE